MTGPGTPFGRLAALAILALVTAAVWLGPVRAYRDLIGAGDDEIAAKQAVLQRYRALAGATEPAASGPSGAAGLVIGDIPDSQAVAQLQESLKAAANATEVEVKGLQVLRPEPVAGMVRVGIRLRAAGEIADIGRLLYAIEAARPVLLSDNLRIQSHGGAAGAAKAAAGRLDFQLDVSALKAGQAS